MSSNLKYGNCALCGSFLELCKSHAIPDAYFRRLFTSGGGQGLQIIEGVDQPAKTQDSGWDRLLCKKCENGLANKFDTYGFENLRRLYDVTRSGGKPRRLNVDHDRLARFFHSILWRCSVSKNEIYLGSTLPFQVEYLSKQVVLGRQSAFDLGTYRVFRLVDPDDLIDKMNNIVLSPTIYPLSDAVGSHAAAIFMIFGGIVLVHVQPQVQGTKVEKAGFLSEGGEELILPDLSFLEFPPLMNTLKSAYIAAQTVQNGKKR